VATLRQDSTKVVGKRPRHPSFLPRSEAAASRTTSLAESNSTSNYLLSVEVNAITQLVG